MAILTLTLVQYRMLIQMLPKAGNMTCLVLLSMSIMTLVSMLLIWRRFRMTWLCIRMKQTARDGVLDQMINTLIMIFNNSLF